MATKKVTKKNFNQVLDQIKRDFKDADNETQRFWINSVNGWLDDLASEDFFGTECQCDPRGDQRG